MAFLSVFFGTAPTTLPTSTPFLNNFMFGMFVMPKRAQMSETPSSSTKFVGKFFNHRAHHHTRTAPGCPEVNKHKLTRRNNFVKGFCSKIQCCHKKISYLPIENIVNIKPSFSSSHNRWGHNHEPCPAKYERQVQCGPHPPASPQFEQIPSSCVFSES